MSALRPILIGLVLAYAIIALGACALQDRLIYFPDHTPIETVSARTDGYGAVTTADGETLRVWRAAAEPDCPTLLHLHGNGGHIGYAQPLNEAIVERTGAGFMAVSWRGYVGSTGAPSQDGLVTDALSAFDHLVADGVPGDEIIVHGFSLGAYPATRVAAERDVAFLLLEAPYESVLSVAQGRMPFFPVRWLLRDHYRADQVIGDVVEPIYIVHGDADRVIDPVQSERLLEHVRPGGETARYVFAGAGHNDLLLRGFLEDVIAPAITRRFPLCRANPAMTQPLQAEG